MATGLYLDNIQSDAGHYTAEPLYTPKTLQRNAAFQWDCSGSSAPFADTASIEPCSEYLEPVLRDLGLKQWQLHGGDPAASLNSLYELVQRQQDLMHSKEQMQEEMQKLRVDLKTADKAVQRLKCQNDQQAQEAGGLNIKLRQLEAWYREETERWNVEREQSNKRSTQLEQRHAQFQHELRRKDAEYDKLQKQLAGYLKGSKRGNNSCTPPTGRMTTSNSRISTPTTSTPKPAYCPQTDTRRSSRAELEDLHRRVVEAYESDKQDLLKECTALRSALQSLEQEHKELLNKVEQGQYAGRVHSNGNTCVSDAAAAAAAAADAIDPSGTLQLMQARLEALKVRKQRVTGTGMGLGLEELQQHVQSANERLLMAKLLEAGKIMEEQETAAELVVSFRMFPINRHW